MKHLSGLRSTVLQAWPNSCKLKSGGLRSWDVAKPAKFSLSGELSTWIQAVDRNTAECIHQCLKEVVPRPSAIYEFNRKVRLVACDDFSGHDRSERYLSFCNPSWATSKIPCQAHKLMVVIVVLLVTDKLLDIPKDT